MIQRKQTIYLLIATILIFITLFLNLANIGGSEGLKLTALGGVNAENVMIYPTWGVISIGGLAAFMTLISVFFYKKRKVQINLTYISALLVLFFYFTFVVYLISALDKLPNNYYAPSFGICLPVVALVFQFLAIKGIKADEKLVKSLDRIR